MGSPSGVRMRAIVRQIGMQLGFHSWIEPEWLLNGLFCHRRSLLSFARRQNRLLERISSAISGSRSPEVGFPHKLN